MPQKNNRRSRLSPQQAHDLDVEISFVEGVVRRAPEDVAALQVLGDDYTRRGRFADGLKVDEQLSALVPDDPLVHYNLACSCALTGQPERAVAALHRALDLGYRDGKWIRRDPDLRSLRKHPLFQTIRERLRTMEIPLR